MPITKQVVLQDSTWLCVPMIKKPLKIMKIMGICSSNRFVVSKDTV